MGMMNVVQKGSHVEVTEYFGRPYLDVPALERRRCVTGYHLRYIIKGMVRGITTKVIKHYFGGRGAATTEHVMLLPRLPRDWLFTKREQDIILGYAAHEICHQLYTRFSMLDEIFPEAKDNPSYVPTRRENHLKAYWNAIEDYRIEKVSKRDYPGFFIYINTTRDHSGQRFVSDVKKGAYTPKQLSNPFFIGAVALTWVGARLNRYSAKSPERALELISPMLRDWVESWSDDLSVVATNQDSIDLATRMLDDLYARQQASCSKEDDPEERDVDDEHKPDDSERTEDQVGGPAGGDGGQSTDDEGQEAGAGTGQEEGGTDGQPPSKAGDGQDRGTESEGGSAEDGTDHDDREEQAAPSGMDLDDDVEDASRGGDRDPNGRPEKYDGPEDDGEMPGPTSSRDGDSTERPRPGPDVEEDDDAQTPYDSDLDIDDVRRILQDVKDAEAEDADIVAPQDIGSGIDREKVSKDGTASYAAVRASVGGAASRSAGIVRRMLQARNRTRTSRGLDEGTLDFERVVGMALGHTNVYKQTASRTDVNTAITLLLDNSGSMTGHPLRVCQKTAVVLDMAVAGTKTAIEITGFTTVQMGSKVKIYQYRTFEQKGVQAAASLGNMTTVQLGGTPVATPMLDVVRRMTSRPEERRIVIVVSDGAASDPADAKRARLIAEAMGCIVVGISIGNESDLAEMRLWCASTVGIADVDELPHALTMLVQEIMR